MDVGYKLYELRRSRGLTQAELGRRVGVSEAAIRAYETGKRRPKQAHLERIADALGVRPEAIADYGIDDVDEAIHLLFRLGEDWKLRQDIFNAVKAWGEMRKRLEAGEITDLEYVTWRDGYTAKKQVG